MNFRIINIAIIDYQDTYMYMGYISRIQLLPISLGFGFEFGIVSKWKSWFCTALLLTDFEINAKRTNTEGSTLIVASGYYNSKIQNVNFIHFFFDNAELM